MKPRSIKAGRILLALLTVGSILVLISWDRHPAAERFQKQQYFNDTPQKGKKADREKKGRDLDDVLNELDAIDLQKETENAHKEAEKAMKELDATKIKMQVDQAMKEIDLEKMQKELKESVGKLNIDMSKMKKELAASMKEFDSEKVNREVQNAMKEVDADKITKQVNDEVAKIDWEKMKKNMDEVKKIDMSKMEDAMENAKKEMKDIGPRLDKVLQKAKEDVDKAKKEMREYKEFVDGLDKDGLIRKSDPYSITHKDGELIINGKKASNETYLKYRSFLEKHPTFNIKKSDDDFNINVD